jgi:hypothetical protein
MIQVLTILGIVLALPLTVFSQSITDGEKIFKSLKQKYSGLEIAVHGGATKTPVVALFLPETEWSALSKPQQVSLTLYVESFIAKVRTNPDSYVGFPSSAPAYNMMRTNIANIKDGAWSIGVGPLNQRGDGPLYDHEVVMGDTAWEDRAAEYGRSGFGEVKAAKGSDFRK